MEKTKVNVVFRVEKSGEFEGEVTAVLGWNQMNLLECYSQIGQHSSGCYEWYQNTRPATPEEYTDLLKELESIGYEATVKKRLKRR